MESKEKNPKKKSGLKALFEEMDAEKKKKKNKNKKQNDINKNRNINALLCFRIRKTWRSRKISESPFKKKSIIRNDFMLFCPTNSGSFKIYA